MFNSGLSLITIGHRSSPTVHRRPSSVVGSHNCHCCHRPPSIVTACHRSLVVTVAIVADAHHRSSPPIIDRRWLSHAVRPSDRRSLATSQLTVEPLDCRRRSSDYRSPDRWPPSSPSPSPPLVAEPSAITVDRQTVGRRRHLRRHRRCFHRR